MSEGDIVQEGPPREVYEKPNSRYVAEFIGTTNFLPGTVVGRADGSLMVGTRAGVLTCLPSRDQPDGQEVLVSIRPEYVQIGASRADSGTNVLKGTVKAAVFLGEYADCLVEVAGHELHVRAHPSLRLEPGQRVYLTLPMEQCVAVADEPALAGLAVE